MFFIFLWSKKAHHSIRFKSLSQLEPLPTRKSFQFYNPKIIMKQCSFTSKKENEILVEYTVGDHPRIGYAGIGIIFKLSSFSLSLFPGNSGYNSHQSLWCSALRCCLHRKKQKHGGHIYNFLLVIQPQSYPVTSQIMMITASDCLTGVPPSSHKIHSCCQNLSTSSFCCSEEPLERKLNFANEWVHFVIYRIQMSKFLIHIWS